MAERANFGPSGDKSHSVVFFLGRVPSVIVNGRANGGMSVELV